MSRLALLCLICIPFVSAAAQVVVTGELRKWHDIVLTFDGPRADEADRYNPFLHYRLDVTFRHDSATYVVPGYFAADGDAANTGATGGTKWRAHFAPDRIGCWRYTVSFRRGSNIAVAASATGGETVTELNGLTGTIDVLPTDKTGRDLRSKGRLLHRGGRYPVWAETGEWFYKNGTDAPENLLAYADFDGSFHNDGHKDELVKTWTPHLRDWREGDPTWGNGRGKGLIGAINYLSAEGLNAFSFLTLNIVGDDRNVFPYVLYDNYERMDVSKLAQWEIVFRHADRLGMFLHFKTSEAENQGLLDGGELGTQRKLYYRELIARFGHHLALNWNIGEENGQWLDRHPTPYQTTTQRLTCARYFYDNDPYRHPVVIHNGQYFFDLLGPESQYDGISLQTHRPDFSQVYPHARRWLALAREAGRDWMLAVDEPGDAQHSLVPDTDDPDHDLARQNALWGTLLAGAWGTEWYFGYDHAHSDLTCEDWRSRDRFWDQCRYLLQFLAKTQLPLPVMEPANDLTSAANDWVLAHPGETYLILLKQGEKPDNFLRTPAGNYMLRWFDPRNGTFAGEPRPLRATTEILLDNPPLEPERDWIILIEKQR